MVQWTNVREHRWEVSQIFLLVTWHALNIVAKWCGVSQSIRNDEICRTVFCGTRCCFEKQQGDWRPHPSSTVPHQAEHICLLCDVLHVSHKSFSVMCLLAFCLFDLKHGEFTIPTCTCWFAPHCGFVVRGVGTRRIWWFAGSVMRFCAALWCTTGLIINL